VTLAGPGPDGGKCRQDSFIVSSVPSQDFPIPQGALWGKDVLLGTMQTCATVATGEGPWGLGLHVPVLLVDPNQLFAWVVLLHGLYPKK
jgi:hypothetical protein